MPLCYEAFLFITVEYKKMIAAGGDGSYVSSSFLSQLHKSPFVYNLFKFRKISDDDLVYVIKYRKIIMARFRRYIAYPPFGSCPICCMIDSRGRFTMRVVCSCLFDVTGNHTPMACESSPGPCRLCCNIRFGADKTKTSCTCLSDVTGNHELDKFFKPYQECKYERKQQLPTHLRALNF